MSDLRHVMHWAALFTRDIRLHRRKRSKSTTACTVENNEDAYHIFASYEIGTGTVSASKDMGHAEDLFGYPYGCTP